MQIEKETEEERRNRQKNKGWIGVDLDGTLAMYSGWQGAEHIGDPIPKMVERVKAWLAQGFEVRIFTARVHNNGRAGLEVEQVRAGIERWCLEHLGVVLPVTNLKDYDMIELWDDRAIQVIPNTGLRADHKDTYTTWEEEIFRCPSCEGHWFGSSFDIENGIVGNVTERQCHDQYGCGCRWTGKDDAECFITILRTDNPNGPHYIHPASL